MILYDPETSGGLLASVNENKAGEFLTMLKEKDIRNASIIGKISQT